MKKRRPVRMYCDKEFKLLLKKKALDNGFEEYPKFTAALAKNPDLWNYDKKKRKKEGSYGLF